MKEDRGFTIVELLIVIVVIAILAAIVVVAYNGVQNRARSTSAQASAAAARDKSEAYNAEQSTYPAHLADLTGAASTISYYLSGVTIKAGSVDPTSSDATTVVSYYTCTGGGNKIGYYDFANTSVKYLYTGPATSSASCTISAT
jgi:prepilin-type N-terminal cleavage/methylation domain-containing protein